MSSNRDKSSVPEGVQPGWQQALRSHPRAWQNNRYVYPVLSRRARGISIGINLSPDQVCNFQCVYCQVDRSGSRRSGEVDPAVLKAELAHMLEQVGSGDLFRQEPFAAAPLPMRRVSDIAFSGDGEPTAAKVFPEAARLVVDAQQVHNLPADMKIVVLTNATLLDRPGVQEALDLLHAHAGQVWAKLDAGTEPHYWRTNRCPISFRKILDNIALASKRWRVVIQSMWLRFDNQDPDPAEVAALADRLGEIVGAGGRIEAVQVYTLARQPVESYVTPLAEDGLRDVARMIEGRTGLPVEVFPSPA